MFTWLYSLGFINGRIYVTNYCKEDGAGSQFTHTVMVQALCKSLSIPYAHTTFGGVKIKPHRTFDHSTTTDWEYHLNLGDGYVDVEDLKLPKISCADFVRKRSNWTQSFIIHSVSPYPYIQSAPNALDEVVRPWRARHNTRRKSDSILNVGFHIRRGDVDRKRHPGRYTENSEIIDTMEKIRRVLERSKIDAKITLYSEGEPSDFEEMCEENVRLRLNGNPLDAFIGMQNSDILVTAKSAFSYLAALFNPTGIIIYEPFWLPPYSDWLGLDDRDLDDQLYQRLKAVR